MDRIKENKQKIEFHVFNRLCLFTKRRRPCLFTNPLGTETQIYNHYVSYFLVLVSSFLVKKSRFETVDNKKQICDLFARLDIV